MNFKSLLSFLLLFLIAPSLLAQIEGPNPMGSVPEQARHAEPEIPPPKMEEDDYYEKFQQLINEFDQSMENMNPDDIITFTLKQGIEEVKILSRKVIVCSYEL